MCDARGGVDVTLQDNFPVLVAQGIVPTLTTILQWPLASHLATVSCLVALRNLTAMSEPRTVRYPWGRFAWRIMSLCRPFDTASA
jgi:hypothetical protein